MKEWKLRFYVTSGRNTGNVDHEEFFDNAREMKKRYDTIYRRELWSLNPTFWLLGNNGYIRVTLADVIDAVTR